jgi:hypothetical protein
MNLRSITVEDYVFNIQNKDDVSPTALAVKIHSYYSKNLQPVDFEKITSVINDLVKKEIICKKGQNYSIIR